MDILETDKLNIATKTKLGVCQVKNTANINSLDNVKITKVLTVSAKPRIDNVSVVNAEIKFDGVVEYDLLVALENNEIVPFTQKSNFSQVFENAEVTPETIVNIYPQLIELNDVSNMNGDIAYSTLINFEIYAIGINSSVCCAKPLENIFSKESEISYNTLGGNIVYDATINFEIPKDSKVNKVLFVNSFASIKTVIPSNGYFVVTGDVYSSIIYQSDDGLIKSINKETNFSEEIENQNVNKESVIQACIATKETIVVENSDKNSFSFDTPIQIVAQIYNKGTKSCIVDAFSLTHDVNLTTVSFEEDEFVSTRQAEENIITNFVLADSIPIIDKILAIAPINISIVNQIVKSGELLLEGIATINLIYYFEDDDGNNILNSIDVEVPYSLSIPLQDLEDTDKVITNIILGDISIKNKRGKELEILAEAKINYDIIKNSVSALTTSICLGEEKQPKDYALEIYLAKEGQTLWDVAKELNIATTDIVNQNSDLTLPLTAGENIVAYRQRQVNFE